MRHVVAAPEVDAEIHRARSALLTLVAGCSQRRIVEVLEALEAFMGSARARARHRGDPDVMRRFYMDRLAARQAVGGLRLGDRRAGRRALDRYVAAEERAAEGRP